MAGRTASFSAGLPLAGFQGSLSLRAGAPAPIVRLLAAPISLTRSDIRTSPASSLGEPRVLSLANQPAPQKGAPGLKQLLQEKDDLIPSSDEVAALSEANAWTRVAAMMDRVLGIEADESAADAAAAPAKVWASTRLRALERASVSSRPGPPPLAPAARPGPARGRAAAALAAVGRISLAGGAVFGLQVLAAGLLPAVFGFIPAAAIWAVSSGILVMPVAVYARYRLSLRDSPRLSRIRWILDAAIGAYLGAAAVAAPGLAMAASFFMLPLSAAPLMALAAGRYLGPGGSWALDSVVTWGSLAMLPVILGAAAPGVISIGPLLGLMALPAMTTLAFFLGRIIHSAESGKPFSIPGSMQKIRFPIFQWIMLGVVFALLTGFAAVYSNYAFLAWQFLGEKAYGWNKEYKPWQNVLSNILNFNTLYLGLLAFTAATGFASPLTFLVIAFAPERAAKWTEVLLRLLLPKSKPAPSTEVKPLLDPDARAQEPPRWPNFHYRLKTGLLIAGMAVSGLALGFAVFGFASLGKNLAVAAVFSAIPFLLSTFIIKKVMRTSPASEAGDPEFFSIVRELRGRINAERAAKGKKPIPMPEMVIDPMEGPNAYATGRSPFHALVGVTKGIKAMTLDAENLRAGLIELMDACDAASKSFKAFRKAMAGSIAGIGAEASPREAAEAIRQAPAADIKKLGCRALRGVLAHELSHVMDRHMLLGAMAGAISTAVAFASYGVLWAVSKAEALARRLQDRLLAPRPKDGRLGFVPVAAGASVGSALVLLRAFAAVWAPIVMNILQMASSRSDEGMADEDGAKLSGDPEALALALGLLTTWRPKTAAVMDGDRLPLLAANAHLYTVNPIEQMARAGVLPKFDAAAGMAVGKLDDFLFNLFITHPDTTQRIERLYDMSEAGR